MKRCPAPWCGADLADGESHPGHERLMSDPAFDPKKHVAKRKDGGYDIVVPKEAAK